MEMPEARRNDVLVLARKEFLDAVSTPCGRNRLQERRGERQFAVDPARLTFSTSSSPKSKPYSVPI